MLIFLFSLVGDWSMPQHKNEWETVLSVPGAQSYGLRFQVHFKWQKLEPAFLTKDFSPPCPILGASAEFAVVP